MKETIVAPITAPGQAAVSLVRISGPHVREILCALSPFHEKIIAAPRKLILGPIYDLALEGGIPADSSACSSPADSQAKEHLSILDRGFVVFFKAPHSYTGEDSAEFHLHGSSYLLGRLVENILSLGARLALPGEFTQRAFLNGRMDLSQAEAVADIIAAETQAQAKVAQEQLEGRLSKAVSDIGEPLRNLLAEIEAYIDFPEEDLPHEDLTVLSLHDWKTRIAAVLHTLDEYLNTYKTGRLYREGASVVIVGLPNAGKSSLLNRLIGEERAIVTPIPGTTRDSIEERISHGGLALRLCDTAGLADWEKRALDEVEKIGIEHSWKRAKNADLILYVFDSTRDVALQCAVITSALELKKPMLMVASKVDLLPPQATRKSYCNISSGSTGLLSANEEPQYVSAITGEGIEELKQAILKKLLGDQAHIRTRASVMITTQRHYDALMNAASALRDALRAIETHIPPELITIDLRSALGALNDIIGVTHNEDILGRIFSRFCIGK